jgi:capsular polysaccharide transport system ATP-binding protein
MVVGDFRFHERCHHELFEKRRDRAFILVTHDSHSIKTYCERACVLHEGRLHDFSNVDHAYEFFHEVSMKQPEGQPAGTEPGA